jgi:hypothetical protein
MSRLPLTPDQAELSDRIYQSLRQAADADLRGLADLLASKPDRQLLGQTEFEVRDRVHKIGAKALETALEERKKGGTRGPVGAAHTARSRPGSSSTAPRRCAVWWGTSPWTGPTTTAERAATARSLGTRPSASRPRC